LRASWPQLQDLGSDAGVMFLCSLITPSASDDSLSEALAPNLPPDDVMPFLAW
jgi:hypothetical protein